MKRKSPLGTTDNTGVMNTPGSDAYLRNAVMTATPEQLHLMLYDGAIRFATQARDALQAKRYDVSYDRLSRAQKIVLEMQNALRPEVNAQICAQMASLYEFVYRKLVDANIQREIAPIDDALKILHHQRETWMMVIEKVRKERGETESAAPTSARPALARAGPAHRRAAKTPSPKARSASKADRRVHKRGRRRARCSPLSIIHYHYIAFVRGFRGGFGYRRASGASAPESPRGAGPSVRRCRG